MDGGAVAGTTVTAGLRSGPSARTRVVLVEQAVFTSMRSPTGEGYRIVAASKGICADEKREITRCAPSHASLCDSSAGATGLGSFVLPSGRQCIFLSRYQGVEHTARGGYRVHTRVLVMDPAVFRQFHGDPLEVETAVVSKIRNESTGTPPLSLEPLTLQPEGGCARERGGQADAWPVMDDMERVARVLSAVLSERPILVVGAPMPRNVLRWVLGATPIALRCRLSLSCGLKFSPARRFDLVLADVTPNEIERTVRDHGIDVIRWETPPTRASGAFKRWLRFVQRQWQVGRGTEVKRLSAEITEDCTPTSLDQIADLCDDIDRVPLANKSLLRQLTRRYLGVNPAIDLQRRLLSEFRQAAEARRAAIERAEQESSAQDEAADRGGT